MHKCFNFSTFLPTYIIFCGCYSKAFLGDVKWYFIVVLPSISLVISSLFVFITILSRVWEWKSLPHCLYRCGKWDYQCSDVCWERKVEGREGGTMWLFYAVQAPQETCFQSLYCGASEILQMEASGAEVTATLWMRFSYGSLLWLGLPCVTLPASAWCVGISAPVSRELSLLSLATEAWAHPLPHSWGGNPPDVLPRVFLGL